MGSCCFPTHSSSRGRPSCWRAGRGRTISRPERRGESMAKRILVALNLALATALVWSLLGGGAAYSAGHQVVTIAAPAFVGVPKSAHNDGLPNPKDGCAAPAPLMAGNEHFGDLDSAKGSFLAFVRFPDGAKVTRF